MQVIFDQWWIAAIPGGAILLPAWRLTCWAMACAMYWSRNMTEQRVIVDALNIDYPPPAWSTT
jgi:hypothetical protein